MKNRTDNILLAVFLLTLTPYAAFFAYCFSELPLSITPPQQALLLYSHSIPMFFLQLLLCRTAKLRWRLLIPPVLLLIPGLVFVSTAGWHVIAWVLFGFWCIAPAAGCVLGWIVYGLRRKKWNGEAPGGQGGAG